MVLEYSVLLLHFQTISMSSQVLAPALGHGQFSQLENRRVANYHLNIWGDQFISYSPEDEVIEKKSVRSRRSYLVSVFEKKGSILLLSENNSCSLNACLVFVFEND